VKVFIFRVRQSKENSYCITYQVTQHQTLSNLHQSCFEKLKPSIKVLFFGGVGDVELLPPLFLVHRLLEEISKDTKHNYKILSIQLYCGSSLSVYSQSLLVVNV
jgi:hypothetical protein